jgi:hypothetical protein
MTVTRKKSLLVQEGEVRSCLSVLDSGSLLGLLLVLARGHRNLKNDNIKIDQISDTPSSRVRQLPPLSRSPGEGCDHQISPQQTPHRTHTPGSREQRVRLVIMTSLHQDRKVKTDTTPLANGTSR